MRKKTSFIIALLTALMCCCLFAACADDKPEKPAATPTKITLSGMKTRFDYGEEFSSDGLVVTVALSDDTAYTAKNREYICDSSQYKANVAGEYTITVKLKNTDISETYKVTVAEDQTGETIAKEITLSGMKTQFEYGEEFSTGGLTVTVLMSDGTSYTAETDEYTCDSSQYMKYTAGEYTVTVKLKNTDISETYTVTVGEQPEFSWDDDGALKILTIGNSFSDDTMQYAWDIANALGIKEIYLGNMYIGGCTLDTHIDNAIYDRGAYEYRVKSGENDWMTINKFKLSTAIASREWDFISLQQASGSSGMPATYDKLQQLIDYVKDNMIPGSRTKIVWNMTWAYQQDSTHGEFGKYNGSQTEMYSKIVSTVKEKILTNDDISAVIPCGTAIQNARTSYLGDALTRDGYHLTFGMGRYIAGLTLIHSLTGLPVDGISYLPNGVAAEDKVIAVESATNAALSPYAVTQSVNKTETPFDAENYDLLEYTVTQGFYDSTFAADFSSVRADVANLSNKFFATKRFTPDELPVGSVITLSPGWQYRPERWINDKVQTSRPDNVSIRKFTVTPEWWSGNKYRAFNISKIGTPVIEGQSEAANSAMKIYIPKTDTETTLTSMGYEKLEFTLTQGFYNSSDKNKYSEIITGDANLSSKFFATKRFTREELPVGSVIVLESGWQYRPEAWKTDTAQTTRPAEVTVRIVVITEDWWSGYMYRAFNIKKSDASVLTGQEEAARAALRIYKPTATE